MARLGDPGPPVQRWRGPLTGCWVRDGPWGDVYYAGALLPDGNPCLVRARVEIDPSPERLAPYRLDQWAVFAGEGVWDWGKGETVGPDPAGCLKDVERFVGERGVRMTGG